MAEFVDASTQLLLINGHSHSHRHSYSRSLKHRPVGDGSDAEDALPSRVLVVRQELHEALLSLRDRRRVLRCGQIPSTERNIQIHRYRVSKREHAYCILAVGAVQDMRDTRRRIQDVERGT